MKLKNILNEKEDTNTGTQELSCTAGVCELVDITSFKGESV